MARAAFPPCRVLVDSREPHPDAGDHESALFRPWVSGGERRIVLPCERVHFREGDYSLPGFAAWKPMGDDAAPWQGEEWIAIERKGLSDAIATVVGTTENSVGEAEANRDRLAEELRRMQRYAFRTIVVEGTQSDVYQAAEDPRRRFNPLSVVGSYAAFATRFGVQVWWASAIEITGPDGEVHRAPARASAEWYVGTVLQRAWREYVGQGEQYKRAVARGDRMPWIGKGIALP